jgi:RimJ/RimL family protein N-acetyltransferase
MDWPARLCGHHIRLEPLEHRHGPGLVDAAGADPSLYRWSPVPQGESEVRAYIDNALAWKEAGTAVPLVVVRIGDEAVVGSTRFWNLERWPWPLAHPLHGRRNPDVGEIGYSWLTRSAVRTAANTEMKHLMLTYAFEQWGVECICFHTDVRNTRSRAALERIGARFEGVLRAHRMAADHTFRDSARFSILASDWPAVRQRIEELGRRQHAD